MPNADALGIFFAMGMVQLFLPLYALSHINPLPHFIFPIILILVQPYHELNLNKTTIIRSSFTQFIYSEKKKKNCNLS
jgi:hypothetical protein